MKKIVYSLTFIALCFSCTNDTVDAEKQKLMDDMKSLRAEMADKDSSFTQVLSYFSDIQNNLNEIKKREGIVTEASAGGDGLTENKKNMIVDDLQAINALMAENKNKISELRKILNSKNSLLKSKDSKISDLESTLNSTLETLNQTVLQKDSQIAGLREDLTKLRISHDLLVMENTENLETIETKKDELNTVYYCYGTYKELKEKGVLTKEGGLIGIGRTTKLKENANLEYFTQVDARTFNEVELNTKNAELVSSHPAGSYKFAKSADGKKIEFLIIEDAQKFWSVSKYLVIKVS